MQASVRARAAEAAALAAAAAAEASQSGRSGRRSTAARRATSGSGNIHRGGTGTTAGPSTGRPDQVDKDAEDTEEGLWLRLKGENWQN